METPPRAWGRHPPHRPDSGPVGNTPTSVGKTLTQHGSGESLLETPPRAWGRLQRASQPPARLGNTPTSVGKTEKFDPDFPAFWKHPHERGEDRAAIRVGWLMERNTPTSVGKTRRGFCIGTSSWKHPHERGEDHAFSVDSGPVAETPPRAWGRLQKSRPRQAR